MIKFNNDEDLGKVVAKKQLFCSIGVEPLKKVSTLAFAAGARKFSCLCGIDFTTIDDKTQYKNFTIAFVSKIRSKIYRRATANPSQWFIFRKINPVRVDVLDKKALLVNYGFDIDKFFQSDLFSKAVPAFEKYIKAGLTDAEQFKKKIEKTDVAQANEVQRYIDAIKESLPLLKSTSCNDKYWKLIDYDVRTESENQVNEEIDKDVPQKWIDFCNELNAKIETNVKVLIGKYFKDYPDGSKLVDSIMSNIQFLMFDEDGYNEAGNLYEEYFHTVLNSNDYKLEADENVDEAGKQNIEKRKNTGGKAFARGCMKILLTVIALTSSTIGLSGMLITWLSGLLTNCCNKLNNKLNDAEEKEVKLSAEQGKEVSKAYADANKKVPEVADAEEIKKFLSKNKSALDKLQSNDKLPDEAKKNIKQIVDFLNNAANGNVAEEVDEAELDAKIEEAMKKIYGEKEALKEYHTDIDGDPRDIDEFNPRPPIPASERDPDFVDIQKAGFGNRYVIFNNTPESNGYRKILFINRQKKLFNWNTGGFYKTTDPFLPVSRESVEDLQKFLADELSGFKNYEEAKFKTINEYKLAFPTVKQKDKIYYLKGEQLDAAIQKFGITTTESGI